jgi:aminoglycoside phosphotransferase (APT) family kinase protein
MVEFNAEDNIGTIEVQEKHRFDVGNLDAFMRENVDGYSGELSVEEFAGGQSNPTYLLTSGSEQYVMRRKPPGELLKSAHAVDREYKVLTALQNADVPAPRTYALCTDDDVIGTWFYIMEYQPGRVIWDVITGDYTPDERGKIFDAACVASAKLHNVDYEAVGLSDFGKHGDYIARQLKRWGGQYEYTKTVENPYMKFEVIGILDWELSTLGNPISDFAYHCRIYHDALAGLDLKELGIPAEEDYIQRYCELTGRSGIEHWNYYIAFNMFRLAAILQGIARRVLDGTAASKQAEQAGEGAYDLSKLAWGQIDPSALKE